jgi:hypothetical protein
VSCPSSKLHLTTITGRRTRGYRGKRCCEGSSTWMRLPVSTEFSFGCQYSDTIWWTARCQRVSSIYIFFHTVVPDYTERVNGRPYFGGTITKKAERTTPRPFRLLHTGVLILTVCTHRGRCGLFRSCSIPACLTHGRIAHPKLKVTGGRVNAQRSGAEIIQYQTIPSSTGCLADSAGPHWHLIHETSVGPCIQYTSTL